MSARPQDHEEKVILIVEDEPDNRDIMCSVVRDLAGYTPHAVANGEEALAIVPKLAPDLILLDLMLPEMDGFEVARRLKANPSTSGIPILAISALSRPGEREHALGAGCDAYVDKPFSLDDLVVKINDLLHPSAKRAV